MLLEELMRLLMCNTACSLMCFYINKFLFAFLGESFKNSEIVQDLGQIKSLKTDIEFAAKINDCFWIHKNDYESASSLNFKSLIMYNFGNE